MLHGCGKEHHALALGGLGNHIRDNGRRLAPVSVIGAVYSVRVKLAEAVRRQACGVIARGVDFPDHRFGQKTLINQFPRAHFVDALGKVGITRGVFAIGLAVRMLPENPPAAEAVRRGSQAQHPQVWVGLPHFRNDALHRGRDAVGLVNDNQGIAICPTALEGADPVLDGQGRPEHHAIAQFLGPGAGTEHAGPVPACQILAVVLHHKFRAGR